MMTHEVELKALMLASRDGDAASHRALLNQLSSRLRAYYKGKLARVGRSAEEAEEIMAYDDNVDAESTYDVKRLMERLPKNMRCSIEAVKLDGLSIVEAAERCGISESGVKVNIHRGLKALAALIAKETRT